MEPAACEDLKAFERRLTEVVSCYKPATLRWRSKDHTPLLLLIPYMFYYSVMLTFVAVCTSMGAWHWISDPRFSQYSLMDSLLMHPIFTVAAMMLFVMFLFGVHKLIFAPKIITMRMRAVLADFNMSCDDTGKLILKPRPNN